MTAMLMSAVTGCVSPAMDSVTSVCVSCAVDSVTAADEADSSCRVFEEQPASVQVNRVRVNVLTIVLITFLFMLFKLPGVHVF